MHNIHQELTDLVQEALSETPKHINGIWLSEAKYRKLIELINEIEPLEKEILKLRELSSDIFEHDMKILG